MRYPLGVCIFQGKLNCQSLQSQRSWPVTTFYDSGSGPTSLRILSRRHGLSAYLSQNVPRAIPRNSRISNFSTNKTHSAGRVAACPKKLHLSRLPLISHTTSVGCPDRASTSILVTSYFGLSPTKLVPLFACHIVPLSALSVFLR